MTRSRRAVLTGDGAEEFVAALPDWTIVGASGAEPIDLLIEVAGSVTAAEADWPAATMGVTADVIDRVTRAETRLRAGGLALVVVDDPPERAHSTHPGGGVLAAALATAVRLLATDWARIGSSRCLLAVRGAASVTEMTTLARWLAADDAPPLTGQTIDLAAVKHATLLPPS
jgi:hypothetical protein